MCIHKLARLRIQNEIRLAPRRARKARRAMCLHGTSRSSLSVIPLPTGRPAAFERVAPRSESAEGLRDASASIQKWLEAALQQDNRGSGLETTPFVSGRTRYARALDTLFDDLRGFFEREAFRAALSDEQRRTILEGMLLTRATDNRMKQMFLSGELKYNDMGFQGKGFRSLGQEVFLPPQPTCIPGPRLSRETATRATWPRR